MRKKTLMLLPAVAVALTASAAHPVDFSKIKHWTGTGPNRAALVVQFNGDTYGDNAYVWGYRWEDGTAPNGEMMLKAICANSSRLSMLTQFTGTMGSTVCGLGYSLGQDALNHVKFDFEKARTFEFINFDYYNVSELFGQTKAPGDDSPAIAQAAIDAAKEGTHYIQHPFDARTYGYPAYDYDCWRFPAADEAYLGDTPWTQKWVSAWYEGYWSFWCADAPDQDFYYSGMGFTGRTLVNNAVDGWSFTQFDEAMVGGMGEGAEPCTGEIIYVPSRFVDGGVEVSKAVRTVGNGLQSIPVVVSWGDNAKIDNVVYRLQFDGTAPTAAKVAGAIAASDPAFTAEIAGDNVTKISLDADGDGAIGTGSDVTGEGEWTLTEYEDALVLSRNPEVTPAYLFYLPVMNEPGVWIPEAMTFALSDADNFIPVFVQRHAEYDAINYTWYRRADDSNSTHSNNSNDIVSSVSGSNSTFGRLSYKGDKAGDLYLHVRARIGKGSTYAYSNVCHFTLLPPEVPISGLQFELESVDAPLNGTIENTLTIFPEDATYTKLTYKSSDTKVASASATAIKTTTTPGEATITVTSTFNPEVNASFAITSSLKNPVEQISVKGVEGDTIVLNPKRMIGVIGEFTPANADIQDMDVVLEDAGTDKASLIASMYKVNYWDASNTRIQFNELSGHRVGECTLTLKAKDGSGVSRRYIVRVEEPDRTPLENGYTDGTIMLNEEWFGHTNGGLNYITPEGKMMYQVYERENPGMSFGATSQYGAIWAGKLIVASKQAIDGGDPLPGGGRVVVADAATLKRIGSIDDLMFGDETKSADGRAVVGATPGTAYVGSSNGIYIIDLEDVKVIGKIEAGEDDGTAADLYNGQIGDMVRAGKYVFAIKQSTGTFIIDTETDKVVKLIEDSRIQGVTQSADGNVWLATLNGNCSQFICIDPATLEERTDMSVILPESLGKVVCSWGAWRNTPFVGSHTTNTLWFTSGAGGIAGGSDTDCFYGWEIGSDVNTLTPIFDLGKNRLEGSNPRVDQKTYGTLRYDERSKRLIIMTTENSASGHYRYNWTYFIDPVTREITDTIALEPYYWFQAFPIFPDALEAEIDLAEVNIDMGDGGYEIDLAELITDRDNIDYNIAVALVDAPTATNADPADENAPAVYAVLKDKKLKLQPLKIGTQYLTLSLESNGRVVTHTFPVNVSDQGSGIENVGANAGQISCDGRQLRVQSMEGVALSLYDLAGRRVINTVVDSADYRAVLSIPAGVYLLTGSNGVTVKIVVK